MIPSDITSGIRPVGIALIGCGRISEPHLEAIVNQPGFGTLVAVVDPDIDRARAVAARYHVRHAFADLDDVLGLDGVDAVVLCTPNALHAGQAATAMEAGLHVLVEKPFSETVADAEHIAGIADRTGLVLAAGHTFRHVDAVRTLQDRRHEFGALRAVNISMCVFWDGPQAPWWAERTAEQGLILSLFAPHAIDFLQLAVGEVDPIRVHAEKARHQSGWKGEDEAMILLRYPDDVIASIHLSYNQRFAINRKTLHFEKAVLAIENGDELWIDGVQAVTPPVPETVEGRLLGAQIHHYFATQFREFALAVRGRPNRSVLHPMALRQTRLNRRIVEVAADG
jgi:predicted dehydrogenase